MYSKDQFSLSPLISLRHFCVIKFLHHIIFITSHLFHYLSSSCQQSSKYWAPKQRNKTAQPKADKYPTSHFSSFICFLNVLYLKKKKKREKRKEKRITLKIHVLCFVLINSILLNFLCVWVSSLWHTNLNHIWEEILESYFIYIFAFPFNVSHLTLAFQLFFVSKSLFSFT